MATTVIRFRKARYLPQTYKARYLQVSYSAKLTNVYFVTVAGFPYSFPYVLS